jgi:predicted DNA-binding ribbon-helix-helix protein
MKSAVIKRTVYIDGRKTGVSIEDAFWSTLKEIAHAQGATVSQMVTDIAKLRQGGTLSGAIRLFVLDRVRSKTVGATVGKTAAPYGVPPASGEGSGTDGSTI